MVAPYSGAMFATVARSGTDSEAARAWAPAYENYTFQPTDAGTRLVIDQDVTEEFADYMAEAWPKALEKLKNLCESGRSKG